MFYVASISYAHHWISSDDILSYCGAFTTAEDAWDYAIKNFCRFSKKLNKYVGRPGTQIAVYQKIIIDGEDTYKEVPCPVSLRIIV